MIRIIKRYESRKLYDTEESRYVSLEDIAKWVRDGQEVKVIDNATSSDVSAQILTQIILDEGKRGTAFLPSELLHDLVRAGEKAVATGVERVQGKVDRLVQASMDRLGPVRQAREEMTHLRERLSELERTLSSLENEAASAPAKKPAASKATARKPAAKTARKPAAKTARKPAARKSTAAKKTAAAKTEAAN
ncbi:MAG: polyhydroxyalkanoate synthesis regulator DNA-binding domain-containing protein [Acidobacteriota bacterium]